MPFEEEKTWKVVEWRILQADGKEICKFHDERLTFQEIKVETPKEEEKTRVKTFTEGLTPTLKLLPLHNARWRMIQRAYKIMKTDMFERTLFTATPKVIYMKCELENF